MRATTIALYVLPFATAAVVAIALFVVGAPRPFSGARLYGGTTEGVSRLSFRLAVADSYRGVEAPAAPGPVALEVELADGRKLSFTGETDELGTVGVAIDVLGEPVRAPFFARVTSAGQTLAEGKVWLSREDWLARSSRRGGWYRIPSKGELSIRVAPGRGALAVPFADPIWMEVRRNGAAVPGALVHVESEGLRLAPPHRRDVAIAADAEGRVSVIATPLEHAVSLRVVAEHEGARGEWYATLPVVPGSYSARLQDGRLRIESPVLRDRAFFAILSETARFSGGAVTLEPDGRGGAVQLVDLPRLPEGPIWAAVSSEPELASDSTVGWPLHASKQARGEPPTTFEAPDHLLLDGVPLGEQADSERRSRARRIAAGFTVLALLLASVIVIGRTRRADTQLRAHLAASLEERASRDAIAEQRGRGWLAIAVLCIALGFAVIALVALYRLS